MYILRGLISDEVCADDLNAFVLDLTAAPLAALGATPTPAETAAEPWDRRLARVRVLRLVTGLPASPKLPDVTAELEAYLDGSGELSPDVRTARENTTQPSTPAIIALLSDLHGPI